MIPSRLRPSLQALDRAGGGLPLSFAQQGFWFMDQLVPGNPFCNMSAPLRLRGALDGDALRWSLRGLVRRHEVLRTRFEDDAGQPRQVVDDCDELEPKVVDLGGMTDDGREAEARRLAGLEAMTAFDLGRAPLLRGLLLRLGRDDHVFVLTTHHIVCDGSSWGVLARDLQELYDARRGCREPDLEPLPYQYADYAAWERDRLTQDVLDRQLRYWKRQLAEAPEVRLPVDRARPPMLSYRAGYREFVVPEGVVAKLREATRSQGATLYMTLLAAFQALLARHAGQADVSVATPIATRARRELRDVVGPFLNTLVVRTDLCGEPCFRELVGRVRKVALEAYEHRAVPFQQVVTAVHPQRSASFNPLAQVLFQFVPGGEARLRLSDLDVATFATGDVVRTQFDLELHMFESDGTLWGRFVYSRDLFETRTLDRIAERFERVLEALACQPDRSIGDVDLLGEGERQRLEAWNRTEHPVPQA
ncbi:MAG TPA: condensation domain-containing protein, partial [Candidatus Eisenbacteria bacterium]|nr:condensation domain-containing protein [Candidatus Eisenbacteria bacterium]